MSKEDIRNIIEFLKDRVKIEKPEGEDSLAVSFESPMYDEMLNSGMNPKVIDAVLKSSWWDEMITDIVETPDFCEPGADQDEVLGCARDVVFEYIAKRIEI